MLYEVHFACDDKIYATLSDIYLARDVMRYLEDRGHHAYIKYIFENAEDRYCSNYDLFQ